MKPWSLCSRKSASSFCRLTFSCAFFSRRARSFSSASALSSSLQDSWTPQYKRSCSVLRDGCRVAGLHSLGLLTAGCSRRLEKVRVPLQMRLKSPVGCGIPQQGGQLCASSKLWPSRRATGQQVEDYPTPHPGRPPLAAASMYTHCQSHWEPAVAPHNLQERPADCPVHAGDHS